MRVSALDINGDWTCGAGRANYIRDAQAIRQNVRTRVLSFKNDWFLDTQANIDWITILGTRNNRDIIRSEVERVVLATDGVTTLDRLEIFDQRTPRGATIIIEYSTVLKRA